jgi:hypothetical protein
VNTILGLVTESIYAVKQEDIFAVAKAVMEHLIALSKEQLVRLGDDSIDICHKVKQVYCHHRFGDQKSLVTFEYYKLYHGLVLRLLQSSDESLKLLGWVEVECKRCPFP